MSEINRIGIFGGTFNPVHKGHEMTAVNFYDKCKLNELIIMPCSIPPHKQLDASVTALHRLEMCEIAFAKYYDVINIRVSDFEMKREGTSYSIDTLIALNEEYKNDKLYFLAGSDMFLYLEKWYRYRDLLDLCVFTVAFRNNSDKEQVMALYDKLSKIGANIELLENEPFEISSTELRSRINDTTFEAENYISRKVLDYIKEKRIYVQ